MSRAVAKWAGGIYSLVQYAAREDGALFVRHQRKDPRYGYRWGAWRQSGKVEVSALPESIAAGFATCYRGEFAARLPN